MAPQNSNPPALPPTVEEAYRRKCIQLKERFKEIEDENDAYRLRVSRLKRHIQKCRLERALLLEQVSRRTSTNVEDSDGSPSPPPTPKDKPLRIKRGHSRKQLAGEDGMGQSFLSQSMRGMSPGSETYSQADAYPPSARGSNGVLPKPPKRPSNAFEIYCNDMRPKLQQDHKDEIAEGQYRLEEELARGWKDLDEKMKEEFQVRYEEELQKWKEEREAYRRSKKEADARDRSRGRDSFYGGGSVSGAGRGRGPAASSRRQVEIMHGDDDGDEMDQDQGQDIEMGEVEEQEGDQPDSDPETEVEDNEPE